MAHKAFPRSRRLLALLTALVTAVSAAGACSVAADRSVTVLGPWSGEEGQAFREVLDRFTARTGITAAYQGTSAVNEVLRSKVREADPPDVAISWSPSELSRYVRSGHLRPLTNVVDRRQQQAYRRHWLLPQGDDIYAIPVKANLKNLIWYRVDDLDRRPGTWAELMEVGERRRERAPWCLALNDSPAAGWPGTDWIENILLHQSPDHYRRWATGDLKWASPQVTRAWETWGQIVTGEGLVQGGVNRALLADFRDAGRSMFARPPGCMMVHAPSFAVDSFREGGDPGGRPLTPGRDFDFFPFPSFADSGAGSGDRPANVSADLAAMFRDTPEARRLMAFLASPEAQRIWPSRPHSSAFSLNTQVPETVYGRDEVRRRIARLLHASGDAMCFDASDAFPPTMRSAFNQAVLEYVNDPRRLSKLLEELDRVRAAVDPQEWVVAACADDRN